MWLANVPTHGNQFQGLGCALVTSRGRNAGEALLAPFVLTEHTLVLETFTSYPTVNIICTS